MIAGFLRTLYDEPQDLDAPQRTTLDWVISAAMIVGVALEAGLRSDWAWPAASVVVAVVAAVALLWRRTSPLAALATAFGVIVVVDIASLIAGVTWEGAWSMFPVLLFPYSIFRWGPGRHAVASLGVLAGPVVLSVFNESNTLGDIIGGAIIMLLACEVGAHLRYQNKARAQAVEAFKVEERQQLARELHDTVAHHVSAIAVQAQAGRAVAAVDPEAATGVLAAIEEEASRALAEMRAMVGVLRREGQADLTPQLGIADLATIADGLPSRPEVRVRVEGDIDDLLPAVDAAVYRLAQESITNAIRHADRATVVEVNVATTPYLVRLRVRDDGRSPKGVNGDAGFGLRGMAERVKLLGGRFGAGPADGHGWIVEADLPRSGAPS